MKKNGKLSKIVSGGQTGVDRAALDVALNIIFRAADGVRKGVLPKMGLYPNVIL